MKGPSSRASERTSAATPTAAPNQAAAPKVPRSHQRYAAQRTPAVVATTSDSDITRASWNQTLGLKATMSAVSSPTRSPPTRRPAQPNATTPSVPMTHENSWWARNDRNPSAETPASTVRNPGGWSAPGIVKPW